MADCVSVIMVYNSMCGWKKYQLLKYENGRPGVQNYFISEHFYSVRKKKKTKQHWGSKSGFSYIYFYLPYQKLENFKYLIK